MAYLIAELCQNHNGNFDVLEEMVSAAAESGADYAKIQAISSVDLTFRERFENGLIEGEKIKVIKRPYKNEYERLKNLDLSEEQQLKFVEICKKNKIKPMTTIFTRNKIDLIRKMKLETLKVSSFDCASLQLIDELKSLNLSNLIVSTGATFDREIRKTAELLKKNKVNFSLLHCISIYPTPLEEANLLRLNFLKKFTNSVGISDHSNPKKDHFKIIAAALNMGAQIVEKHFTILAKDKTKDGPVSANPSELKEISNLCKYEKKDLEQYIQNNVPEYEKLLGLEQRELSETELLNRDYYQGRFASKVNGETIFNWDKRELA